MFIKVSQNASAILLSDSPVEVEGLCTDVLSSCLGIVLYKYNEGGSIKAVNLMHDEGTVGDDELRRWFDDFRQRYGEFDKMEIWSNDSQFGIDKGSLDHRIGFAEFLVKEKMFVKKDVFINPDNLDDGLTDDFKKKFCRGTQTGAFYVKRDGESEDFVEGGENGGIKMLFKDKDGLVHLNAESVPIYNLRHSSNMIKRCFEGGAKIDEQYDGYAWVGTVERLDEKFLGRGEEKPGDILEGMEKNWRHHVGNYNRALAKEGAVGMIGKSVERSVVSKLTGVFGSRDR